MNKKMRNFEEKCGRAAEVSHTVLREILKDNEETEYGKKNGFGRLQDLREYRRLPLTDYADYAESIERMKRGEKNVLTAYDIKYFLLTSGSSGVQKNVPLTTRALEQGWDMVYEASLAQKEGMEREMHLHTSVFRIDEEDRETLLSCAYFAHFREKDKTHCEKYVGGEKLLFTKGIGDVCYVKLWLALSEPNLYSIQSIFLYDLLLLMQYFKENWERLLWDMEARHIPEDVPLSAEVRENLLAVVTEKARLTEIRQECEKGFAGICRRLWKRLDFASGIGGNAFEAQEQLMCWFLGDVPIHYFTYTSTEALVGIAVEMENTGYVCIPDSGFLEFLPYGEDTEETKWIEDVEIGKWYELVVTNFSGLYRYRLEDVVEVVGFYGQSPVLRYLFRKNLAVNIAGEKTNQMMVAGVVTEAAERWQARLEDYSVCIDREKLPCRYCFFLEGEAEPTLPEERSAFLDKALRLHNPDYDDLRNLGEIGVPVCYFVREGAHGEWKAAQKKKGHSKPLPLAVAEGYAAFMKERILLDGTRG